MTQIKNLGDHVDGTLIAESQATKATTSNALDDLLSDATQLPLDITITGNRTLTDDEFFGQLIFDLSGSPAADFSLFLPNSGEHWFIVRNNTGKVCTVDAGVSGGTVVELRESLSGLFHSDGTSVISTSDPDIMRYSTQALDETTDFFLFWDESAGALRRILGENLPGSSSAGTGAFPFKGAMASNSVDLTGQNYSAGASVTWDQDTYDTDDWHDTGSNTSRLTVPAGVKKVLLSASVYITSHNTSQYITAAMTMNGSTFIGSPIQRSEVGTSSIRLAITSGAVEVIPGDYFEVSITTESDTSVTVEADTSYFSVHAIETTESGQTATVQTTNADQTVIATGAMASDSAHTIRACGQGREDATGDTYHFEIFGGARNEGGTSSAPTPNVIEVADAGASTWDATLEANDTSDEWEILITGEAAHTIDWTVTYFEIVQEV